MINTGQGSPQCGLFSAQGIIQEESPKAGPSAELTEGSSKTRSSLDKLLCAALWKILLSSCLPLKLINTRFQCSQSINLHKHICILKNVFKNNIKKKKKEKEITGADNFEDKKNLKE